MVLLVDLGPNACILEIATVSLMSLYAESQGSLARAAPVCQDWICRRMVAGLVPMVDRSDLVRELAMLCFGRCHVLTFPEMAFGCHHSTSRYRGGGRQFRITFDGSLVRLSWALTRSRFLHSDLFVSAFACDQKRSRWRLEPSLVRGVLHCKVFRER